MEYLNKDRVNSNVNSTARGVYVGIVGDVFFKKMLKVSVKVSN